MALEAWSMEGALRRVCDAMDCTVVRVFFTRWFSSLMRRSFSRTAALSSSMTRRRSMAAPRRLA